MKHDGYPTRLQSFIRANAAAVPEQPVGAAAPDLVQLLVHSFLVWEATLAQAEAAMGRIRHATVSFNDFRVCLVNEVVDLLGPRYPRVQERAIRVRAAINDLFRREHSVSLERASNMSKRDAKTYIESLQGMVPFVSARVSLLGLGVHGVPVDEQTLGALIHQGVLNEEMGIPEATGWLQRHISAEKALAAHAALQRGAETFAAKVVRGSIKLPRSARRDGANGTRTPARDGARESPAPGRDAAKETHAPARDAAKETRAPARDAAKESRSSKQSRAAAKKLSRAPARARARQSGPSASRPSARRSSAASSRSGRRGAAQGKARRPSRARRASR